MWNKNLQEPPCRNVLSTRLQPCPLAGSAVGSWGHGKQISGCPPGWQLEIWSLHGLAAHRNSPWCSMPRRAVKKWQDARLLRPEHSRLYKWASQSIGLVEAMQAPLNRADAPMSNWQLGMAPGWLCFQLDWIKRAENMAVVARFRLRSSLLFIVMAWNKIGGQLEIWFPLRLRGFDGGRQKRCVYFITFGFSRFLFEDWEHFWKESAGPIESSWCTDVKLATGHGARLAMFSARLN